MKFVRRVNQNTYVENQDISITIGMGGGTDTDTVENIPKLADTAIEVELDDGSVVVLLGYLRK